MSEEIRKLTDYSHVRLRTEMYLGSRSLHTQGVLLFEDDGVSIKEMSWVPALLTMVREILDNAVDEMVGKGHGNKLDVTFDPESMIFSIEDNGRGVPITYDDAHDCHAATLAFSHARAGRNFNDDDRKGVAGLNGIGSAAVNFTSEYFEVEIHRDNKKFYQKFTEGNEFFNELNIMPPVIKDTKSGHTGTKVTFKPSSSVYSCMTLPFELVKSRLIELALVNPKLKITLNGEKIHPQPITKIFGQKPIVIETNADGFTSSWYLIPGFSEGEHAHSIVNNVPVFDGGHHVDEFRFHFGRGMLEALSREAKRRKLNPNKNDVRETVLVFNVSTMDAPYFANQAKTKLINEEAKKAVTNALKDDEIFKKIVKQFPEYVDQIFERCADRTQKKDQSDTEQAAKKLLKKKIPKLVEANSKDRMSCILHLSEGDSALAGMANARDPNIHAGLPLRGKILNTHGLSGKDVLDSQSTADIMNAIGLIPGKKAIRSELRYGTVCIMTDADVDGGNIQCLLLIFMRKFWPELFDPNEKPFVQVFMTPFVIAEKGKERKYWYQDNYHEFKPDDYKGWTITRAKGLGTLTKTDWQASLKNPRLIPIVDDGMMDETLDLIFNGSRADDRKIWMQR